MHYGQLFIPIKSICNKNCHVNYCPYSENHFAVYTVRGNLKGENLFAVKKREKVTVRPLE